MNAIDVFCTSCSDLRLARNAPKQATDWYIDALHISCRYCIDFENLIIDPSPIQTLRQKRAIQERVQPLSGDTIRANLGKPRTWKSAGRNSYHISLCRGSQLFSFKNVAVKWHWGHLRFWCDVKTLSIVGAARGGRRSITNVPSESAPVTFGLQKWQSAIVHFREHGCSALIDGWPLLFVQKSGFRLEIPNSSWHNPQIPKPLANTWTQQRQRQWSSFSSTGGLCGSRAAPWHYGIRCHVGRWMLQPFCSAVRVRPTVHPS